MQMGIASASASSALESVLDRLGNVDHRLDTFERQFEIRERLQAPEGGFSRVRYFKKKILRAKTDFFSLRL